MKKVLILFLVILMIFGTGYKKANASIVGAVIIGGAVVIVIGYYVMEFIGTNNIKNERNLLADKIKKSTIVINKKKYNVAELMDRISNARSANWSVVEPTITCEVFTKYPNPKTYVTENLWLSMYFAYDERKKESEIIKIVNLQSGEIYDTPEGVWYVMNILTTFDLN